MKNNTKINLNRFKSYTKLPNQDFLLLAFTPLTLNDFVMFIIAKNVLTDWDKDHGEKYRTFSKDDLYDYYVRSLLFSENKFNRSFRNLTKLGLLKIKDDKRKWYRVYGLTTQQSEILGKKQDRKHGDNPFYYLQVLLTKVDRNKDKNDRNCLQKFNSFVSNSTYKRPSNTLDTVSSKSIYNPNIEPYKDKINSNDSVKVKRLCNGVPEDEIDLDDIPF